MPRCGACGIENPERAKFCLECGSPLLAVAPERFRRTVTIVFSDVVGSTALGERLDPETLSRVMTEYFAAVRPAVDRHGGVLAKFIGDAVMAVFGLTELHEDDALRAVRAALEMRETLQRLNPELERRYGVALATRTGINTGAVAGEGLRPDQNFVAGDTANTAARLQAAAGENEILLGAPTYRLVREAVEAELLPPLEAKGKTEPLTAYRLVSLLPERERHAKTPLVGRQRELDELEWALRRCVEERRCRLVTVVAPPGVGKSRLVREFVSRVGAEARVLEGRCLPYGEGITFWPLAQMIRQAAGIGEADAPEDALAKLREAAPSEGVAERVGQAIGLLGAGAAGEDTAWAVRLFLEALASARPLVCVCDDVQWAEPVLLDLLEQLAERSREAPILLCCLARPELLEARPGWPGAIALDPLTEGESDLLLRALVGDSPVPGALGDRIAEAAGGNPLFIEQLVAMLADEGPTDEGDVPVPPTIQALLAARLERLEHDERHVLTRAAVAGQTFYRGALLELVRESLAPCLDAILLSLVRKEFVAPARSDLGSERAFVFRHLLIRDAAYEALTKEDRTKLHARFGQWLHEALGARAEEVEEIVGYHLEQAYRLRTSLAPPDDEARELAEEAAERLAAAGRRAFSRGDLGAAATLMSRAAELLSATDIRRAALLVDVAEAAREAGRFGEAEAALEVAVASSCDERTRTMATIGLYRLRLDTDTACDLAEAGAEARRAAEAAEAAGDDAGAAAAWRLLWHVNAYRCQYAAAAEAAQHAAVYSARIGDPRWASDRTLTVGAAARGTEPTSAAITLGEQVLAEVHGHRGIAALVRRSLSSMRAMRGEFELARRLVLQALSDVDEGRLDAYGLVAFGLAWDLDATRGDWASAERELRGGYAGLVALGATAVCSTVAALLAHCLCALGREDEAEQMAATSAEMAGKDDLMSQALWRTAQARVLVRRGEAPAAIPLAREAVAITLETDALVDQGAALEVLAEVLQAVGRAAEARAAAEEALHIYERKEHLVGAARVRTFRAELEAAAAYEASTGS